MARYIRGTVQKIEERKTDVLVRDAENSRTPGKDMRAHYVAVAGSATAQPRPVLEIRDRRGEARRVLLDETAAPPAGQNGTGIPAIEVGQNVSLRVAEESSWYDLDDLTPRPVAERVTHMAAAPH